VLHLSLCAAPAQMRAVWHLAFQDRLERVGIDRAGKAQRLRSLARPGARLKVRRIIFWRSTRRVDSSSHPGTVRPPRRWRLPSVDPSEGHVLAVFVLVHDARIEAFHNENKMRIHGFTALSPRGGDCHCLTLVRLP